MTLKTKKEIEKEIEELIKMVNPETFKTVCSEGYETVKRLISVESELKGYQEAKKDFEEMIDEEISSYQDIFEEMIDEEISSYQDINAPERLALARLNIKLKGGEK